MNPCSSWAPWGPMPPDPPGFRYIGPWCGACEPVKASSSCVEPWPEPARFLEWRYAPRPSGPWGEPSYVTPAGDLPLSDWSEPKRTSCGEHEFGQYRVIESKL